MARTKKKPKARRGKGKPNILLVLLIFAAAAGLTYFVFMKLTRIKPITTPTPKKLPQTVSNPQPVVPTPQQLHDVTADDFKIAGMSLQSTSEEITNLYGDPLEIKKDSQTSFQNPAYQIYTQVWEYPDLDITFINHAAKGKPAPPMPGTILMITVKSNAYPTGRGIKIGDPLEQALTKYGRIKMEDGSYTYNSDLGYLEFKVSDGKISTITIGQNMD